MRWRVREKEDLPAADVWLLRTLRELSEERTADGHAGVGGRREGMVK